MTSGTTNAVGGTGRALRSAAGFVAALAAGLAAVCAPARAADPVTGSGEFTSRGLTMPVVSSVAYRGKSLLDKEDVILVAISNHHFDLPWMAMFHDRTRLAAGK